MPKPESTLIKLIEGEPYIPGPAEYVIREDHSIEDVLRHLLSEITGGKLELITILELLKQ